MRQNTTQDVLIEQNGARMTVVATLTPDTETGDPDGWAILYRVPEDGVHELDDARPYSVVSATGQAGALHGMAQGRAPAPRRRDRQAAPRARLTAYAAISTRRPRPSRRATPWAAAPFTVASSSSRTGGPSTKSAR